MVIYMDKQFAHPNEVGAFLNEKEIESVAQTLYSRFVYDYGLKPDFRSSAQARDLMVRQVKRTLDALNLSGFVVTPANNK